MGDLAELEGDLGHPLGQALARAHVDGHPGPAPVVDPQPHGHVGLGCAVGGDALLLPVAGHGLAHDPARSVLGPHHVGAYVLRAHDLHRPQSLHLLVPDAFGVDARRWLEEGEGQDLQDVVLDDVAQRPGRLVEPAAVAHAQLLGHGDLNMVDVAAVPDRLEDGVGEAQRQHVLDRLFPEVVVDAVQLGLLEHAVQAVVELEGAGQVAAVGLLHHDAHEGPFVLGPVEAVLGQRLGHVGEHGGHGGQVVDAVAARAPLLVHLRHRLAQALEGGVVGVLAAHIAEAGDQPLPRRAGVGHGLAAQVPELVVGHLRAGDADHGEGRRELAAGGQPLQGGEQLAAGQVARGAEHDQHQGRGPPLGGEPVHQGVLGQGLGLGLGVGHELSSSRR